MSQDSKLELARRNAELIARVDELTQVLAQAEAVTLLTAGVVHDLRNALHIALIASEALLQSLKTPGQIELAETILSAAEHGAALARDLLDLTRKSDARASIIHCFEFLTGFERLVRRIALQQLFDCTFEVQADVWSVMVERPQLAAALINLSVNARDAMQAGGGHLRVGVRNLPRGTALPPGLPDGDYVEFSVSDTGIGMSPAVLARATEAYFTTKQDSGGSGLGLSVARSFALRSGGALSIESVLQRGTQVRIILPRAPQKALHSVQEVSARLAKVSHHRATLPRGGALSERAELRRDARRRRY